jgi:hypothetical protein
LGEKSQTHVFFSEIDGDFTLNNNNWKNIFDINIMLYLEIISAICKVVMFITTIYLFSLGYKQRESNKPIISFWFLSIFSLIDSTIYVIYVEIFKNINAYYTTSKWWQLIYILVELIIISNFLLTINNIKNKKIYSSLILFGAFSILVITLIYNWDFKEKYYTILTITELIFINTFTIRYLLIISPEIKELNDKKILLIVKGLFLFINIASPYYIIIQLFVKEPNSIISSLSFISDLAYIIFFTSIIKSIKCQQKSLE